MSPEEARAIAAAAIDEAWAAWATAEVAELEGAGLSHEAALRGFQAQCREEAEALEECVQRHIDLLAEAVAEADQAGIRIPLTRGGGSNYRPAVKWETGGRPEN